MKKVIFKKGYTRDNGLIIQEAWGIGFSADFSGQPNPFLPPQINVVQDGAVDIWESAKSLNWFQERLREKLLEQPNFFHAAMEAYLPIAFRVKEYRGKDRFESRDRLGEFIRLLREGTRGFLCFYYAAMDDKTPELVRTRALEIRDADSFYDDADRLIKATVEFLYPHTKGLTISLVADEVSDPPLREELEERYRNSVWYVGSPVQAGSLSDFLDNNSRYGFEQERLPARKEVHGQTAYGGSVRGRVRILRRKDQIPSLREGEILVSPMTTPDFISAMKKSAAIVTDEGGVVSHAAIVARELKKPCITGTRVATQVFKNGDFVEVDATRGIVKIME